MCGLRIAILGITSVGIGLNEGRNSSSGEMIFEACNG